MGETTIDRNADFVQANEIVNRIKRNYPKYLSIRSVTIRAFNDGLITLDEKDLIMKEFIFI